MRRSTGSFRQHFEAGAIAIEHLGFRGGSANVVPSRSNFAAAHLEIITDVTG